MDGRSIDLGREFTQHTLIKMFMLYRELLKIFDPLTKRMGCKRENGTEVPSFFKKVERRKTERLRFAMIGPIV